MPLPILTEETFFEVEQSICDTEMNLGFVAATVERIDKSNPVLAREVISAFEKDLENDQTYGFSYGMLCMYLILEAQATVDDMS